MWRGSVVALLLGVVVLALSAGCPVPTAIEVAMPSSPTPSPGDYSAPARILLGTVLPLTGKESRGGQFFKEGYDLAIAQANAQGGILVKEFGQRLPVKLVVYDDRTDADTSISYYERLVTVDKVHFLLGGYSTPMVFANTVVAEQHGIPMVVGGGAASTIFDRGYKWVFGIGSSVEDLAATMMDFIAHWQDEGELPKPVKIGLAWENTEHGRDYKNGVDQHVRQMPERYLVVMSEPFDYPGAKDHSLLLGKLRDSNADVFLCDAHLEDYVLIARQYAEMGLYHQLVSYGARGPEKAALDALGPASNHIVAVVWWRPELPYPQNKAFVEAFREKYNREPEWYQAIGYETARVLMKGIEQAGTLDRSRVREALASMNWAESILPGQVVRFKPNGQIDAPVVVTQNQPGGRTGIVWPLDAAASRAIVPMPKR